MEQNMGGADKVIRFAVGLAIIGAGAYYGSWWGAVGLIPILTAVTGVCPGYLPFGLSTRGAKHGGKAS
jgi:hypothetical protein